MSVPPIIGTVIGLVIDQAKSAASPSVGDVLSKVGDMLVKPESLEMEVSRLGYEIYAELNKVIQVINADVIKDRITQSRTAVLIDLVQYQSTHDGTSRLAALENSFAAADRISQEDERSFVGGLVYTVNNRLAVIRVLEPNFSRDPQYQQEIQGYIKRLQVIINDANQSIEQDNTVEQDSEVVQDDLGKPIAVIYSARYLKKGVVQTSYVVRGRFPGPPHRRRTKTSRRPTTTGPRASRGTVRGWALSA